MQGIEAATNKKIDVQTQQVKLELPFDSLVYNPTVQTLNSQDTSGQTNSKKIDNRFQASLERQRNLLLNMEQAVYPQINLNISPVSNSLSDEPENDEKVMDIQVDSNNNLMPLLFVCNRAGGLPGISDLKSIRTRGFNQFPSDENEPFSHFVEDDYSRLSQTNASLFDNYELNQSIKMEDAFRDDNLDFKSGPTLAELNLNDEDMIDNLPTVNPNSILCPSMPLQPNKNGFLMGINYTPSLVSNSGLTTTTASTSDRQLKDLVSSKYATENDHHFAMANNQFEQINSQHNLTSCINNGPKMKQEFVDNDLNRTALQSSFNDNQQTKGKSNKSSNVVRIRNKSQGDKQTTCRTNKERDTSQNKNSKQSLSANNQVLCKLLNEKNESLNNLNSIYLINSTEPSFVHSTEPSFVPNTTTSSNEQSMPSTSSTCNLTNSPFQTICVSSLANSSSAATQLTQNLANKSIALQPASLPSSDLILNQLHSLSTQPKPGLTNHLRLNNTVNRNRNSSISTEHSFSSSHDEGFISQAEDDSDEKDLDDSQVICDSKLVAGNKQIANQVKRKRARKGVNKDRNKNLTNQNTLDNPTTINRNLKKIKLEDTSNLFKSSTATASSLPDRLTTVKEERAGTAFKKEEKVASKGRVNYKITKEKPIPDDLLHQNQFKFDSNNFDLITPILNEDKIDEESSDDDDESFYGDYEAGDLIGATTSDDQQNKWSLNMGRSRKNSTQRYFWQYNVQAKGPKGTKLPTIDNLEGELAASCGALGSDLEPLDPVFSPNYCQIEGVKHAGKARRGDGNDLTANPKKLLMIGLKLKKLSKIINDLTPVAEVPVNSKSNSRKEKNKLASRACRLKKKAQHEANKVKLHGLTAEYKKCSWVISEFKKIQEKICQKPDRFANNGRKLIDQLNALIEERGLITPIAGETTVFVNSVLDSVSEGNLSGGLEKLYSCVDKRDSSHLNEPVQREGENSNNLSTFGQA